MADEGKEGEGGRRFPNGRPCKMVNRTIMITCKCTIRILTCNCFDSSLFLRRNLKTAKFQLLKRILRIQEKEKARYYGINE